ncbi:lipopolysaccharide biosynthesis protein [[Phormidium] sp. ETS-05]|uniref:lipopolysaccharide biosynthesis protein n=1 Tax=[Phormidium] sp. ETS-05 TaxID=222819 RepID=UPI0018EF04B0|nr:lipopolysaccharide biosynthesis protein [[Phormidium] sp. ETS-05]
MSDPTKTSSPHDPNQYFRTDHLEADLKRRSVRSGVVTMSTQIGKFILNMGSTAVLARMLSPADYGLVAMVTTITSFVGNFKDLGLSQATVQRAEINHRQVSTLFWINVGFGAAIMVLVMALSPLIAMFYGDGRLTAIAAALGTGFLVGGLSVQHQSLLKRQMRFGDIAKIDLVSSIIGVVAGILAAIQLPNEYEYWSLVIMQMTVGLVTAVGSWFACGWRPGLPVRGAGIRSMLSFGGYYAGFNVINYFTRNADYILIGKNWGAIELGLYTKAYHLLLLPISQINTPIGAVALPALCRLQDNPERYRSFYRMGVRLMVSLGMPVVAFLLVTAPEVILLLLGEKWLSAVPIFQQLAIPSFLGTFNVATGWVYTSLGRTDRQFQVNVIVSAITVASFAIGVHWGALGVATAFSCCVVITRLPSIIHCYRGTPLELKDLWDAIARPAIAAIGAGLALAVLESRLPELSGQVPLIFVALRLAGLGALYTLFYAAIWFAPPNGKQAVSELWQIRKTLKQKPKSE